MIEICREHAKNVKRWRDGTMALRWCAAGMLEAGHQFRRVNGHLHLQKLRSAGLGTTSQSGSALSAGGDGRNPDHPAVGVPPALARTLRSTNPAGSLIEIAGITPRTSSAGGTGRRRCAGVLPDAGGRSPVPPVNGHLHLPNVRAALEVHCRNVSAVSQSEDHKAAC
jgi:hypothetical protein